MHTVRDHKLRAQPDEVCQQRLYIRGCHTDEGNDIVIEHLDGLAPPARALHRMMDGWRDTEEEEEDEEDEEEACLP